MELSQQLTEYFQKLKQAYESGASQICYTTESGEACRPLEVWEKALMVLLHYQDLGPEERQQLLSGLFFFRQRELFLQSNGSRHLNKKNTLELIKYFALCYSKLNDPYCKDGKYFSYGYRVPEILTPDSCLDMEGEGKSRSSKREPLSAKAFSQAALAALNDELNASTGVLDALEKHLQHYQDAEKGEASPMLCEKLVSLVPVYRHSDGAVTSTKENRLKCNIYVADVLFGVLSALIRMVAPWEDPAPHLHEFLKSSKGGKFLSGNGRMQQVSVLYSRCVSFLGSDKPSAEGKNYVCYRRSVEEGDPCMLPFEFLGFLSPANDKTKFSHVVIAADRVENSYIAFKHFSAHETCTNIASTNPKYLQGDCFNEPGGRGFIGLVSFFDLIERLFFAYCDYRKVKLPEKSEVQHG